MAKEKIRCNWCLKDDLYKSYHDNEWGTPLHDDQKLFELLCLEGAQAGLSWYTILSKRENYRKAFDNFENYRSDYTILSPAIPYQLMITDRIKESDTTKWVTKFYYPIF